MLQERHQEQLNHRQDLRLQLVEGHKLVECRKQDGLLLV